jgi:hypothetical protein
MKKVLFLSILFTALAGHQSFGQDSSRNLSELLSEYYSIKNSLVAGSGSQAATHAQNFIKVANTIDYKIISEGNINALLKDATPISETTDLKKQRTYFATLSANMALVAKAVPLTTAPVYQAYCPMKKSYWLSAEKEIKNPYYGNAMLTCGNVVDTITH